MFDFVGKRYWFFLLSALVIVPGVISLAIVHLKPGVDFKSGTSITVGFDENVTVSEDDLRAEMSDLGYTDSLVQSISRPSDQNPLNLSWFYVTIPDTIDNAADEQRITNDMENRFGYGFPDGWRPEYQVMSPMVASETARNAAIAVGVAAVGILLYITFAFRKMPSPFRWGTCAIIALLHDILVVTGIFSILGWAAGVKVDVMFITGMLTVAGYSVHDTIVVFDRIRENMSKHVAPDFEQTVNVSIVQTLTRSLNTSLTVALVLLTLLLLVGGTIHNFTIVLLIGVITGTYSSVCNASQLLIVWENGEWKRLFSWLPFRRKPNPQT